MKIIYIFLIFLIISCKRDEDTIYTFNYIYENLYPEFYWGDRLRFELQNNAFPLSAEKTYKILKKDSNELIDLEILNFDIIKFKPHTILKVDKYYNRSREFYKFYKFYKIESYSLSMDFPIYQIEFPLEKNGRNKIIILFFFPENDSNKMNSAFIRWTSHPANFPPEEKIPEVDHLLVKDRKPFYFWGINKTTDSIITNLSHKHINYLFPEFEGNYIYKKYNKIIVDFKFSTENNLFFKNIELIE